MKRLISCDFHIGESEVNEDNKEVYLKRLISIQSSGCEAITIVWYVDDETEVGLTSVYNKLNDPSLYIDTDKLVEFIKYIRDSINVPIIVSALVPRFEDIKKIIYAGADYAVAGHTWHKDYPAFDAMVDENTVDLYKECHDRFGDRVIDDAGFYRVSRIEWVDVNSADKSQLVPKDSPYYISDEWDFSDDIDFSGIGNTKQVLSFIPWSEIEKDITDYLDKEDPQVVNLAFGLVNYDKTEILSELYDRVKYFIRKHDGEADEKDVAYEFASFKKDANGLVPCIAQDYKTGEVLMMAYMNEESYAKTIETGLMTYWSRSRKKLWTKGEESGHFQHMLSLIIDCDKDTILAKVKQEGPACHTGNPTCFFTPLVESDLVKDKNTLSVFEDVYNVIMDRKVNPKEGSYTNYLFDKGIDKILKKVGEECTEIVIAAKNPDKEEIKYEIADFLYHVMVLMAERGVTWEEIADELARRE